MSDKDIQYTHSRNFPKWLTDSNCSILVTTYSIHKLYCIGAQANGEVSVAFTNLQRPMGVCWDPNTRTITCGSEKSLVTYTDIGDETHPDWGYFDAVFRPKLIDLWGDLDVHDVRMGTATSTTPQIYAVSALFNSIITTDPVKSFAVVYTPHFISCTLDSNNKNQPPCEDRCHLNGLALDADGKPAYATAATTRDYYMSWKEHTGEGVIIDIKRDEVICSGLYNPHSPTLYNNKLYIGEAGTGQFGYVDLQTNKFIPKKFIPGFIRGIAIYNNCALVCTSSDRHDLAFKGLPLHDKIIESGQKIFRGISIISLATFDILHRFEMYDNVTEIYDIAVCPGISRARITEVGDLPSLFDL